MNRNPVLLYKTLVVGIIVLFIGVGIQIAFGITIERDNNPPEPPEIDGPSWIEEYVYHNWTFTSIDPEGNFIWYYVDWGDNENSGWHGPYLSGEKKTFKHQYERWHTPYPSIYKMKAKAKDIYDAESQWTIKEVWVWVPRTRTPTYFSLLDCFPILERLLGLFR